jgi:hypothetical protein
MRQDAETNRAESRSAGRRREQAQLQSVYQVVRNRWLTSRAVAA